MYIEFRKEVNSLNERVYVVEGFEMKEIKELEKAYINSERPACYKEVSVKFCLNRAAVDYMNNLQRASLFWREVRVGDELSISDKERLVKVLRMCKQNLERIKKEKRQLEKSWNGNEVVVFS